MNRVRIIALIAATVGVAVAAGTFFQSEPAQPAGVAAGAAGSGVVPAQPPAPPAEGPRALASITETPTGLLAASLLPGAVSSADMGAAATPAAPAAENDRGSLSLVPDAAPVNDWSVPAPTRTAEASESPVLEADESLLAEIEDCAVWLVVTPAPGALLEASVFAPCDGGARIGIEHAGLAFAVQLGGDGQLMVNLPALRAEATVSVRFADGRIAQDATEVSDFILYDRLAVNWQGPEVIELNAYEFGSGFGGTGHVHIGNPGRPGQPARGFLTVLGDGELDDPRLAQVYTFPSGISAAAGEIALELEAHIAEVSCGMPLRASLIEVLAGRPPESRSIRFDMPECDGQGGYLVLKNLLSEMTLASN